MVKRRVFDRTGGPEAFKEMARAGGPVELYLTRDKLPETQMVITY